MAIEREILEADTVVLKNSGNVLIEQLNLISTLCENLILTLN